MALAGNGGDRQVNDNVICHNCSKQCTLCRIAPSLKNRRTCLNNPKLAPSTELCYLKSLSAMDASSECKKLKLDQKVDPAADRLSELPDMVLQHILSFLPTTDAVGTCILSKRFENMWMSLPGLYFNNDMDFERDLFMNFVEKVLTHRDFSNLHELTLEYVVRGDAMRITTWISAAVRRKVQVLRLYLSDIEAPFALPRCLFHCESLEELELQMSHALKLPPSSCLSSLHKLTLQGVTFPNDRLTENFFANCPVLEELDLDGCDWVNIKAVSISAPRLKRLGICGDDTGGGDGRRVTVVASSLEFLHLQGEFRNEYNLMCSASLVGSCFWVLGDGTGRIREIAYRLHGLLRILPNLTKLQLSNRAVEVYTSAKELFVNVPVYNSLTHLEVNLYAARLDLEGLHKILQNSPRLESLYFTHGIGLNLGTFVNDDDQILSPVPSCFTSRLKTIKVDAFSGTEDEIAAVKILLGNTAVLEKMAIGCGHQIDPVLLQEVRERLLLLPRSSTCSIVLV